MRSFYYSGWLALFALVVVVLMSPTGSAAADAITIAAASDLNFAFKELVAEYEKTTGHHVKLTLGSSGNFFSQIQNGAPFDLYFSADIGYPRKLVEAGLTVPGSLYPYAVGRIVLWAGKGSDLDLSKGLEVLREPRIKKIAIANPKHAPYGRAAVAAMEYFKVYDQVKDRLILGENISQAAQFIESGACDVGIVALSLALAPAMKAAGRYWEIPATAHSPLEQGAVILKQSKNPEAARQFLEFIKGPQGLEIMRRYGFTLPG
ncbi:MAG: molybdate ABC transporter substrate-binding protein [Nitrospirae bacterium]|nr:molybdate ABC transporter substrate-binding protein [Nitrospirota bacterium]MDE3220800.1 molybdate ABC transporter substrate-binding protein [Nitrospirota bacterium]